MATLSHPAAQAARNLAVRLLLGFHAARDKMAATLSEIEIAYAGSPLSKGRHAGTRWAPEHYAGSPPGTGNTPRFVLYTMASSKGAALVERFPTLLEGPPRELHGHEGALLIVRPDGYVGLCAGANDWDKAEGYLERLAPV
jgi:hypothetical protein